ncbi:hypothetical protein [Arthrobacter alpinus]|uniref:hypothetical protein n=1 Tax=Arthrobacter alpinus TaxID=656366 RepID=UPI001646CEB7|nr:hypothetical protein [Arthrobacter alpinus]
MNAIKVIGIGWYEYMQSVARESLQTTVSAAAETGCSMASRRVMKVAYEPKNVAAHASAFSRSALKAFGVTGRLKADGFKQPTVDHSNLGLFSASELTVEVSHRATEIGTGQLSLDLFQKVGVSTKLLERAASLDQSARDSSPWTQE